MGVVEESIQLSFEHSVGNCKAISTDVAWQWGWERHDWLSGGGKERGERERERERGREGERGRERGGKREISTSKQS